MRNRIFFAALLPLLLWACLAVVFLPPLPGWITVPGAAVGLSAILWGNWRSEFAGRWVAAAAGVVLTIGAVYALKSPGIARNWTPEHERLARLDVADDTVTITNFRNTAHRGEGDLSVRWEEAEFRLNELVKVDFVQSILSPKGAIAHGFLSFGFADGRYLAVSIEARREAGEPYSPIRGLFRSYDLFYVFGEETDLIGTRAVIEGSPVYLYPLRASPDQVRALFLSIAKKANELAAAPEFYHTITNNCVTTLLGHVNETSEHSIGYDWRVLFPGFADRLLHEKALLDIEGPLAEAKKRLLINERSRPIIESRQWSEQIRQLPEQ